MDRTRRVVYIVLGTIFLILGTVGIFVPLLPTTPLWLLTCWFYVHSSEMLYNRVMQNRHFGSYVRGFMIDKAIPLRSKIISVMVMWLSTFITFFLLSHYLWIKIMLTIISIGVTSYILSFPTKKN